MDALHHRRTHPRRARPPRRTLRAWLRGAAVSGRDRSRGHAHAAANGGGVLQRATDRSPDAAGAVRSGVPKFMNRAGLLPAQSRRKLSGGRDHRAPLVAAAGARHHWSG